MEKLGLGLELDNSTSQNQASQKDPKEQRKASIEKCIRFLVHATQCHNPHCKQPSCIKMKRVLTHTRECRLMLTGKWNQCTVCKQFVLLCISHAKTCNVDKCPVPVCARIKKNLRDQQNQRRVQANRFMQQRMAQMTSALNSNMATASAAVAAPAPPTPSQASVASPAPPTTSPGNSATSISSPSKAKGSSATHPSNPTSNKAPYMNVPSPASGPRSVGKGGPRTPNTVPGKAALMASSPSVHSHLSPAPPPSAGKPDAGSNMMVSPAPGLPEELTIHKVGPGTGNEQFMRREMMGPRPNPAARPGMPMNTMMNRQEMMGGGHPPGMNHMVAGGGGMYGGGHMGVSQIQSQPNPMMRVGPGGNFHPQHHATAMMRQQPGYRGGAGGPQYQMTPQGRMMQSPMYGGPQQHPSSQLEQILTTPQHHQPHPQYNQGSYMGGGSPADPHHHYGQQPGGYIPSQMSGSHLGPPPQYGANRPQVSGYRMVPGGPRPGVGGGMDSGLGPSMAGGGAAGGGANASFMYQQQQQQQQQFNTSNSMLNNSTNNNNNNNNNNGSSLDPMGFSNLTPQDKLSQFVEHL